MIMKLKIMKGTNNVGRQFLQIETPEAKIAVSFGEDIATAEIPEHVNPMIEGLTCGNPSYNGVFILRNPENCNLVDFTFDNIPIFLEKKVKLAYDVCADFRETEKRKNIKEIINSQTYTLKDLEVTYYLVDSSNLNLKQAGFYDLIVNYKDSYQASNGLSQDITVSNFYTVQVFDELTKLEFVSGNLEVLQYQNLDYSDWQVKATYYSENTAIIDVNLLTFVVDTTKAGEQDVTVSYTEYGVTKSFVVKINVIESTVTEATYTFIANDVAVGDYTSSFAWVDNAGSAPNMIKVLAGSGDNQNISVDSNNKEQDGMTFTQRIKLGGTGNETYRSVSIDLGMFEVGVSVNVKIYALSSSSSADRELEVFENAFGAGTSLGTYQVLGKPTTGDVTIIDLTLEGGKSYSLGSTSGGINLYAIVVSSV